MSSPLVQHGGLLSLAVVSSCAYLMSESAAYGDAPYYADDISKRLLIEPGHLLWRPLGSSIFSIASFFGYRGDVLWILQVLSFLASVGSVLASHRFLSRWATPMVALWGAGLVAFSNGIWAYSISGSSYTAGLLFLLLALIFATPSPGPHGLGSLRAILAGLCGGLAALLWLVYGFLLPVLLGFVVVSAHDDIGHSKLRAAGLFLIVYGATVSFPLIGCYLLLPVLDPYMLKEENLQPGFLGWLASSSHGIHSRWGPVQVLRWVLGWAQSVIAFGDMGQSLRLWMTDGVALKWRSLAVGFMLLLLFYAFLGVCIYKLWRQRQSRIGASYGMVLALVLFSFALNGLFALSWQATDLERYLPSLPFLVLTFCLAVDLERSILRRALVMLLSLSVLVTANFYMTISPAISANSDKNQWLAAIRQHLKKEDLLIVLGNNKFKIVDPHNPAMPKIHNVSMNLILHSSPQVFKTILLNDIQEARKQGGHIFIAESVLGLESRPRDGWSFKEHPEPSPKDLNDLFSSMKGELAFSVDGERVWMAR
jgi:hypothetical protein